MAMVYLRYDPFLLLARMGVISGSQPKLQLCRSRCSCRLASASVDRVCCSLEQDQQSRPGLRCLVFESLPPQPAVPIQQRRISYVEFYSDILHHDARFGGGKM